MKIGVSIVGGTGYGAGELLRLLVSHPFATVVEVVSGSNEGALIEDHHPHLRGFYKGSCFVGEASLEKLEPFEKKIIFFALPHGVSVGAISKNFELFTREKIACIDLSGDLRIKDESDHLSVYPESSFEPKLRDAFVYGLPEIFREEIKNALHISNPGCFATAISLALAPLVGAALEDTVSVTALTGSSGSGRVLKDTAHHPIRRSNISSYNVFEHRHEPEIVQTLTRLGWKSRNISFVPVSAPISRGIFVSATCRLKDEMPESKIAARYAELYEGAPFIRFLNSSPEIENVVGTNFTDLSLKVRGKEVAVFAALDNLVKGMAGQAIQNMNLVSGLKEETGLWHASLRPV